MTTLRMTKTTIPLIALALLLPGLMAACADRPGRVIEPIVWPSVASGEAARIRLVDLIQDASDVEASRSALGRLWDWMVGSEGRFAAGRMEEPTAVVEHNGTVYVVDQALGLIQAYDKNARRYRKGLVEGSRTMIGPVGLTVGPEANLYVTDATSGTIHIFSPTLEYVGPFRTKVRYERPTGIWYDETRNRFYLINTPQSAEPGETPEEKKKRQAPSLTALRPDGSVVWSIGGWGSGKGEFLYPTYVTQRGEKIYVTDSLNCRVQIFDLDGQHRFSFGKRGNLRGSFSKPKGIGIDSEGHIYVVDSEFSKVQIFREDGALLLHFGVGGIRQGQFSLPVGLFVGADDRIYVADRLNRRVQVFQYLGGDS